MPYANCTAAYNDGRADIPAGDPAYAPKLDRDNDGTACELKDAPAGFTPRTEPAKPQAKPEAQTATQAEASTALPQTGPGEVTAVGAVLAVVGAVVVLAVRRRRMRFTA